MRLVLAAALVALLVALGWGFLAGGQPAPARGKDLTGAVTEAWRAELPRDPQVATEAYLARVPAEMRARGEAVSDSRYWVLGARMVFTVAAFGLLLFSGAAGSLAAGLARLTRARWLQDALFAVALLALLYLLTLPVEVFAGYVRTRHFGFADRAFLDWLKDDSLNWAVLSAFYVVGIVAFMALMRARPHTWVVWAGVLYLALASLYVVATPTVIEPMFNTYRPLPDSPLKREILAMAQANGVPAHDVFTGDASRQTRLLNAHVSGVGPVARISIDDNTLGGQYEPGVLFVVGHEIGHYVLGHIFNYVLVLAVIATIGFAAIAWAGPLLIHAFGGRWRIADLRDTAGVAVFWLVFALYGFVSQPVSNAYSRWQEAQADIFGLNATQAPHGMAEFMIHDADIARLSPTPLDVFLFYTHPSDRSRVETAMRWRAAHMQAPSAPLAH